MTSIRYVCLSDLHFGQNDGLLTNLSADRSTVNVLEPSPVLTALCEGLRDLIEQNGEESPKPTLILNGDVLEIALTTMNEAAMAFERFIELAFPADNTPLFDKIIYIPGNHDHHFWEIARESAYSDYILTVAPGAPMSPPWHVSNMFIDRYDRTVPAFFLNRLIRRFDHLKEFQVEIAYPNLGIYNEASDRAIVFHHGHFVEPLYMLMTHTASLLFPGRKPPEEVWDIEAENFAWIDFFWSTMGRSGRTGPEIQEVYNSREYEQARDKLIENLVSSLVRKYDPIGPDAAWIKGITWFAGNLVDGALDHERKKGFDDPLSEESRNGLRNYLEGAVLKQMEEELNRKKSRVSFVFGHTHKPFEEVHQLQGIKGNVSVFNTGGWVVETVKPNPLHGASAVLVDEQLNAVALQLYKETDYTVQVKDPTPELENPLRDHVQKHVHNAPLWRTFSQTVESEVEAHEKFLDSRINK